MLSLWFIAGPPFDTPLWQETATRLEHLGVSTKCHPILRTGTGDLSSEVSALNEAILADKNDVILVGHGTAIPLILGAARHSQLSGIVLTNGPIIGPGRFTRTLCQLAKLPYPLNRMVFHPSISVRFLASSIGLRRAVVNPYVMERDTVVTICDPIITNLENRRRSLTYLKSIANRENLHAEKTIPTLISWGDADRLTHCMKKVFSHFDPNTTTFKTIAGGQFLHPIERPWEIAQTILDWTKKIETTT